MSYWLIAKFGSAERVYKNNPFAYAAGLVIFGGQATFLSSLFCGPCAYVSGGITAGGTVLNVGRGIVRNITYKSELPEFKRQISARERTLDSMRGGLNY